MTPSVFGRVQDSCVLACVVFVRLRSKERPRNGHVTALVTSHMNGLKGEDNRTNNRNNNP